MRISLLSFGGLITIEPTITASSTNQAAMKRNGWAKAVLPSR